MGLRTCGDCNSPVSTSAKACPKCGAKPPKTGIGCSGVLAVLAGLLLLNSILNGTDTTHGAAAPQKPTNKHSEPFHKSNTTKEDQIILALDKLGQKIAAKSEKGAIKYFKSHRVTTTQSPAYKSVFITTHPALMSLPDAAKNPESKMKNLARTAAWQTNFCSEEMQQLINTNNLWVVSGDLTDDKGETQSLALCSR